LSGGNAFELEMKAGHPIEAYEAFQELTGLTLQFTREQSAHLENGQNITLTNEQLDQIVSSMGESEEGWNFLQSYISRILPVVMSLYVFNDALWKMMERNPWSSDKMLAMSTIPYCFWDQNEESATNPKAVKRWDIKETNILLEEDPLRLSIMGDGGDFYGFIERSQMTMRRFGMIDGRGLVPNYQYKPLKVEVLLEGTEFELHPPPLDNIDYDFSEKAQIFREQGCLIRALDGQIKLTVDKKESTLRGDVKILVGLPVDAMDTTFRGPLVDIWLWLLSKLV
jgi:hypothetical protein